jgi:hypothetical protein
MTNFDKGQNQMTFLREYANDENMIETIDAAEYLSENADVDSAKFTVFPRSDAAVGLTRNQVRELSAQLNILAERGWI